MKSVIEGAKLLWKKYSSSTWPPKGSKFTSLTWTSLNPVLIFLTAKAPAFRSISILLLNLIHHKIMPLFSLKIIMVKQCWHPLYIVTFLFDVLHIIVEFIHIFSFFIRIYLFSWNKEMLYIILSKKKRNVVYFF